MTAKSSPQPSTDTLRDQVQAHYDLGLKLHRQGEREQAVASFESAVALDPGHAPSYIGAAEVLAEDGLILNALGCYAQAIMLLPNDKALKDKFVNLARNFESDAYNPVFKLILLECLKERDVDFSHMGSVWHSTLKTDPAFKDVYKKLDQKTYKKFCKAFARLPDHTSLLAPYFVLGLARPVRVPSLTFERLLTHLRRLLLDEWFFERADCVTLASALAAYCDFTEYVFPCDKEETDRLPALREKAAAGDAQSLAVLACYEPLHHLDNAREIEQRYAAHPALGPVVRSQITNYFSGVEIAATIPSLTQTTDSVSQAVKAQYEESPYPRWRTFSKTIYSEKIEGGLKGRKTNILVAGCGTGREAIELAYIFPDSQVLAVDLSCASLSYGIRKARDFGVGNVTFRQADILGLGVLEQKFDYIASSGVLHHMHDPEAGWAVLTGLLKPGGLMRISLYSQLARKAITEARAVIRKKGYPPTADGIRQFRADCKKILKKRSFEKITASADFYALSECRDLLFHVQEHQMTLPRIKAYLDQSGLDFLGFYMRDPAIAAYRREHPEDPAATNLDSWAAYEEKHPDTFAGMYRMWLRKRWK